MAIIVTRSVTSSDEQTQRMLNLFYPVGSYYETSDTTFDPNTAWGGTWVEDTAGRILVSQDTGTFTTVGATGGSETHAHDFRIGFHRYYGTLGGDDMKNSGAYSYAQSKYSKSYGYEADTATERNNALQNSMTSYNEAIVYSIGDTKTESSLQPYIIVKRWHRTA